MTQQGDQPLLGFLLGLLWAQACVIGLLLAYLLMTVWPAPWGVICAYLVVMFVLLVPGAGLYLTIENGPVPYPYEAYA